MGASPPRQIRAVLAGLPLVDVEAFYQQHNEHLGFAGAEPLRQLRDEQVVEIDGWVLALSEARLCALRVVKPDRY